MKNTLFFKQLPSNQFLGSNEMFLLLQLDYDGIYFALRKLKIYMVVYHVYRGQSGTQL